MTYRAFKLAWDGGASAMVDIEADGAREDQYRLHFSSPRRTTIRMSSQAIAPTREDFDRVARELASLAVRGGYVTRGGQNAAADRGATLEDLVDLGRTLLEEALSPAVTTDLGTEPVFIELGVDESLVHLPWELLHDGEDFLALKHYLGRFVIQQQPPVGALPARQVLRDLDSVSALVICVPGPDERDGHTFQYLDAAESERDAVVEALHSAGVRVNVVTEPTLANVRKALREPHELIHFTGHAVASAEDPRRNALVLQDENFNVAALSASLRFQRSLLCFINGCETSRGSAMRGGDDFGWDEQFALFGLARAFLETGAYVLGTRWKLPDSAGSEFAREFYQQLLGEGKTIGMAVALARKALKAASPNDLSWASYVYWGDPRVALRPVPEEASAPPPPAADEAPPPPPVIPAIDAGVLEADDGTQAAAPADLGAPSVLPKLLEETAATYEQERAAGDPGWRRTSRLTELTRKVTQWAVSEPESTRYVDQLFQEDSDGSRVVALALLQARPHPRHMDHLLEAVRSPRSGFEQYEALLAIKRLGPLIPAEARGPLVELLQGPQDEMFVGSDRHVLAQDILARLGVV